MPETDVVHCKNGVRAHLFPGGIRGDDRAGVDLEIIPDPKFRRLKATVDIALAVKLYYTSQ